MKDETRKLRYDRHTVLLLKDHMVFAPKYRGKILTGDVAMITEGILCKTCIELDIEIIEIAVNCDDHLWAPGCYHGSVGNGWEVVEKYISCQDTHYAKSDMYRHRS
jgi:hypothetical protein